MKKTELKALIKPLIKECLKEVLIEEGFAKVLSETKNNTSKRDEVRVQYIPANNSQQEKSSLQNLQENRKAMLDAVAMGGFDPFQGTKPLTENQAANTATVNPGVQAADPGVDISNLLQNKNIWKQTLNAMNGKKDKE